MEVVKPAVDIGGDIFAGWSPFGTVSALDAVHEELRVIAECRRSDIWVADDGLRGLAALIHVGGPGTS